MAYINIKIMQISGNANYPNRLFTKRGRNQSNVTLFHGRLVSAAILLLVIMLAGCSEDPVEAEGKTEITSEVDVTLAVDAGDVGLVIDAREIFRSGYIATEAQVTFPGQTDFNETVMIDPVTNLATLRIPNEDLTDQQKSAFAAGIATDIIIYTGEQPVAEYHADGHVLDDSNIPVSVQSDLAPILPAVQLKAGTPYLLQPEGIEGVMMTTCSSCIPVRQFSADSPLQQFFFIPVEGKTDTYLVQNRGYPEVGSFWGVGDPNVAMYNDATWIFLLPEKDAQEFVLEQEDGGWVRIRRANSENYYLSADLDDLREYHKDDVTPGRFRLISDNIRWSVVDRGTVFSQPIMPPAKIEFAYEATIRNCTPGTLTEEVGITKSRTSMHTTTFTESVQLFNSHDVGGELKVSAAVGGEIYGAKVTVDATVHYAYTHSNTTSTEKALELTTEVTSAVSRTRSLEILPNTGVEVYDAVRVVKGASVPFTQVLRITAVYDDAFDTPLSGDEIITQMRFNFVSGVPSEIGDHHVDVSLRGRIDIDEMFEVESGANELAGACD